MLLCLLLGPIAAAEISWEPPVLVANWSDSPDSQPAGPSGVAPGTFFALGESVFVGNENNQNSLWSYSTDTGATWQHVAFPGGFSSGCCPMAAVTLAPHAPHAPVFAAGFHDMGIGRLSTDTPSETHRHHMLSFTQTTVAGPLGPAGSLNITQDPASPRPGVNISFSGIPYPGVNVSAEWGPPVAYGVLQAAPGRLVALTQVIWNGDPVVDGADGPQQPTSLLAFSSSDGYHWEFAAVLSNASWSPGGMGPSENDLELLADNKTIMAVIRPDGDSACSTNTYRWYSQAFSTDYGQSWTRPSPMPGLGCARPRLKRLPAGPLLLSGGRDCLAKTVDISLWVNADPQYGGLTGGHRDPSTWSKHSISYQHNRLWTGDRQFLFDKRVNDTTKWETLAYTALLVTGPRSGAIIYNHYNATGDASWGEKYPSANFVMRFSFKTDDDRLHGQQLE